MGSFTRVTLARTEDELGFEECSDLKPSNKTAWCCFVRLRCVDVRSIY